MRRWGRLAAAVAVIGSLSLVGAAHADPDPCVDNPDGGMCEGEPGVPNLPPQTHGAVEVKGDSLTPIFTIGVSNPEGMNVSALYTLSNATTGAIVSTHSSSWVPSGSQAELQVESLPPGSYKVRAVAWDGALTSLSYSPTTSFAVTSAVVPDVDESGNQWTPSTQAVESASSSMFLTFRPELPAGHTMSLDPSTGCVLVHNSSHDLVGYFEPMAIGSNDEFVATSLNVSGGIITQTISPSTTTGFPVAVGPVYADGEVETP